MKLAGLFTSMKFFRWSIPAVMAPFLAAEQALAVNDAYCEVQGVSCANLVYQGFTYPYDRLSGSYLYINSGTYPYVSVTNNLLGDSTVRLPDETVIAVEDLLDSLDLKAKTNGTLSPIIGYGSNPAPEQLARKFAAKAFDGDVVVPVMKGHVKDFDVFWTPVFVAYGSMPSTIARSEGTTVDIWVTWLDETAIRVMDATEHSNPTERPLYVEAEIEGADYRFEGPDPGSMKVYISCFGALTVKGKAYALETVPAKGRKSEAVDASGALKAVLPLLDWKDSVLKLVYDNITSPENRAKRSTALKEYGPFPDIPSASSLDACKESRAGPEKPY